MKKLLLSGILLLCISLMVNAQITQEELDNARLELENASGSAKEKKKAYEALVDSANYQNAVYAMNEKDFVLEAEKITFKRGRWVYVTPNTNFISMKDGRATIQIAFEGAPPGPNGIGGITVEGTVANLQTRTDKKGTTYMTMNVNGIAVSATVQIILRKGSNRVTANISPNFSSNRFTLDGYLYPTQFSRVFKGRSL